jgi:hypothetical protein
MATAHTAQSGTLTIDTVATVTVTGPGTTVSVECRTPGDTVWVRVDGVNPTVAGANCFPVRGVRYFDVAEALRGPVNSVVVKLISATAAEYTVEGAP